MVEFKWIITENLENYPFEGDPREEGILIGGDFCMTLNNQEWGYLLPAEVYDSIEDKEELEELGKEELLDLFIEFREKVLPLENFAEANVISLLYNRAVLVFTHVNEKLFISDKRIDNGEIYWTDEVDFHEFCSVCEENIKKFKNEVIKRNPILAENVKKLG